jgi:hypothetical protein
MWEELTDLTFEQWVYHLFDHPEAWYHAIGTEYWNGPAVTTVAYMTRLFEDPVPALEGFSDEELNRGFWYLVSNGGSDMMFTLMDESVPVGERVRCIEGMYTVMEQIFVPRCTPTLSHRSEEGAPLNSACYMWWDLLPIGGPVKNGIGDPINAAIFRVMERELGIDHMALQEGALHGLGHWARYAPERVEGIIDAYLARHAGLREELRVYALSARGGCVL